MLALSVKKLFVKRTFGTNFAKFDIIEFFQDFLLCFSRTKYFVTGIAVKLKSHPEFQITVSNAAIICGIFVPCLIDFTADFICFLILSGCNGLIQKLFTFFRFGLSIILCDNWCIHMSFSFDGIFF